MFDFPFPATLNQTTTAPNGAVFVFDGAKWTTAENAVMNPGAGLYLPLSGSSPMTGPLTLSGNATQPLHAVPLQQINTAAAGGPFLPTSGGTVTGPTTFQYPGTSNRFTSAPTHPSTPYVNGTDQLFSYFIAAADGGNTGDVVTNAKFYTSITGAPKTYTFNLLAVADYNGSGGNAQHVASYHQAIRRTQHAGGTVNNPEIFGAVFECIDTTGTASSLTNTMNGIEIDMTCNAADDANARRGLGMYLNQASEGTTAPTVNLGIHIAANQGSYNAMIRFEAPFNYAALDLRSSAAVTGGAHTIWMQDGGDIAWTTAGNVRTYYDPSVLGSGGLHITSTLQVDNGIYTPSSMVIGGAATLSGGVRLNGATLTWDTASSATSHWDAAPFSGVGAVHLNSNMLIDLGIQVGSTATFGGQTYCNGGLAFQGGSNGPGTIYTDSAWGGLVKGRSGTSADIALQASDGSIKVMIKPVGIGFQGTSAIAKPTVSGAKGSNAALASLLTALAAYGLVTDSTTA